MANAFTAGFETGARLAREHGAGAALEEATDVLAGYLSGAQSVGDAHSAPDCASVAAYRKARRETEVA